VKRLAATAIARELAAFFASLLFKFFEVYSDSRYSN